MGNKANFDIRFKGMYGLHFFEFQASNNQDAKIFDKSFYDYLANLIEGTFVWTDILPIAWVDFSYSGQQTYDDPIDVWTPQALVNGDSWYGDQTIWKLQLSNIIV